VPGLACAVLVHSLFNHLVLNPILETAVVLSGVPLLLVLIFKRSERATRDWLGSGMERDLEILEQVRSGEVARTRIGRYLHSLKTHLSGAVVTDMLCYLRLRLELSLRAKGVLMARAAGLDVPIDPDVRASFGELDHLERSIGRTGLMAIQPFLRASQRDLRQLRAPRS
jgi:hypothetical protein